MKSRDFTVWHLLSLLHSFINRLEQGQHPQGALQAIGVHSFRELKEKIRDFMQHPGDFIAVVNVSWGEPTDVQLFHVKDAAKAEKLFKTYVKEINSSATEEELEQHLEDGYYSDGECTVEIMTPTDGVTTLGSNHEQLNLFG